ncbi:hypothetical protein [Rheinheimera maricola]|uniref:Alpha/beta hydrolase n=1 Tax=Rheinheimera maricola TaxID=2793282 RepID=A0ABS7XEG3_9GAMM|nr:hypothetical protein [Rheinheimera maricola]MBZ9613093.1 hypothetical protein [Rheinheimera maricola]
MRLVFLVSFVLLTGCSSILQHKLEHYRGLDLTAGGQFEFAEHKQFCSDKGCIDYLDLSQPVLKGAALEEFDWSFEFTVNQQRQVDTHQFRFKPLKNNAPVILILPGYGMHKADMQFTALYFREQGLWPIILPGPTETNHFDFGLNHAQVSIDLVRQQFAGHAVFGFGFSMGAAAMGPLSQQLPHWQGGILVAPMQNFVAAGGEVFQTIRNQAWWYTFISAHRIREALLSIQHAAERTDAELDFLQNMPAQANLLILASNTDKVAPFSALAVHASDTQQVIRVADRYHPELTYLWPEMRLAIVSWLHHLGYSPSAEY